MKNPHEGISALRIAPVKNYIAPKYPTRKDTGTNPSILKELPSRWQKNAKVIACIGIMGTMALSMAGCAWRGHHGGEGGGGPIYVAYPTEADGLYNETANPPFIRPPGNYDVKIRVCHGGGRAGSPTYVVHLTEQEALNIIREELEAVGLRFNSTPPAYTVDLWVRDARIHLFDEEKSIGIVQLTPEESNIRFSAQGRELAEQIEKTFAEQASDIIIRVFYSPGENLGRGLGDISSNGLGEEPSREHQQAAAPELREQLIAQVHDFLDMLREQGVID